jgi:serine/threonine protein phosphatase 1
MRKIAIGDIHGCSKSLDLLLDIINPQPKDTIITLGDYIDRGPNSKAVIERLIRLKEQCNYISIMGNHELTFMRAFGGSSDMIYWLRMGGRNTMASYGMTRIIGTFTREEVRAAIPHKHVSFIADCVPHFEDDDNIFVHANYKWDMPLASQTEEVLFWKHLIPGEAPPPHKSDKRVWVGHTPQVTGDILDLGHVVCIDTYGFRQNNGWLTAIDVDTRQVWQTNGNGISRESYLFPQSVP